MQRKKKVWTVYDWKRYMIGLYDFCLDLWAEDKRNRTSSGNPYLFRKERVTYIEELSFRYCGLVNDRIQHALKNGLCPLCKEKGKIDAYGGAVCSKHGPYNLQMYVPEGKDANALEEVDRLLLENDWMLSNPLPGEREEAEAARDHHIDDLMARAPRAWGHLRNPVMSVFEIVERNSMKDIQAKEDLRFLTQMEKCAANFDFIQKKVNESTHTKGIIDFPVEWKCEDLARSQVHFQSPFKQTKEIFSAAYYGGEVSESTLRKELDIPKYDNISLTSLANLNFDQLSELPVAKSRASIKFGTPGKK